MGNTLKATHTNDPEGPGENVEFFRTINIRWLNVFIDKVKEAKRGDFSVANSTETLRWSDYFRIFTEIKDSMTTEARVRERTVWHAATMGYAMTKRTEPEELPELPPPVAAGPPDDYTDDEPSEVDEMEEINDVNPEELEDANNQMIARVDGEDLGGEPILQIENGTARGSRSSKSGSVAGSSSSSSSSSYSTSPSKRVARGWDPAFTSPVFFGYSLQSVQDHEKEVKKEESDLQERENRAIERAKSTRGTIIDALEKSMASTTKSRLDKIEKLEAKYAESKRTRDEMLERNRRELLDSAFALYERNWEAEDQTALIAFDTEVGKMREVHESKLAADSEFLRKRREEMEAFKDAESQSMPAAERLEEFARIEVSRSIDELDKVSAGMEKMRLEYREMKTDFDAIVAELADLEARGTIDKAKQRKMNEMRSMVSVAETRMREAQRDVREGLEGLGDAEILLDRAVRLRRQQDDLLPLFAMIARAEHLPSTCRLNALVISMVILMEGAFDQKYTILFRLFDANCEGSVGLPFTVHLLSSVQDALYLLRMLHLVATQQQLLNAVTRGFMSLGLRPSKDLLTEYELKTLALNLISHSHLLSKVLGLTSRTGMQPGAVTFEGSFSSNMGTFQRSSMSPIALLSRGMINLNMCKMRIHHDVLRYKPQLHPSRKQHVHERAMLMGQDDPLRADYTKFFIKSSKVDGYRVPPLDHGHLLNLQFFAARNQYEAAVKIQAWFRSRHDRKMAELAARHMAFLEAKEAAMKAMKTKVVREFKKREAGKGMGKMKWDAQVRMRQAKLRTQGQSVSRSDTVMIMMEEAISIAKEDIELRFKEMSAREEFSSFNFERELVKDDPAREVLDVTNRFGLILKPTIGDKSMLIDEKKKDGGAKDMELLDADSEEEEEDEEEKAPHAATGSKNQHEQEEEDANKKKNAAASANDGKTSTNTSQPKKKRSKALTVMDQKKVRVYLQGKIRTPPALEDLYVATPNDNAATAPEGEEAGKEGEKKNKSKKAKAGEVTVRVKGESEMDYQLRLIMARAEPVLPIYFLHRMRAMNIAVTKFKVNELLGEIPSKRLFIKYCANHSDDSLVGELTKHFKFKNRQLQIVKHLRNIMRTDLEYGTMRHHLFQVQQKAESGVLTLFDRQMSSFETSLLSMIELRLSTNKKLKEEMVVEEELSRVGGFTQKFRKQCLEILEGIATAKSNFNKVILSFYEVEKKWKSVKRYRDLRLGNLDPECKEVPLDLRQDWILRVNEAMKLPEESSEEKLSKFSELRNVCREFLAIATSDAMIIVNEIYQPKYRKTIPVKEEHVVDGRHEDCGRGVENGLWYTYEAHNIEYKVCLDYDGIFNGSDEFAAKAAGLDRLGAQEYFKLQLPSLHCPLVVTVDFQGFRVLAVSKLPVLNVIFNEEGEVRKMSEELVHGVQSHGEVFVNKSKIVQTYLRIASTSLNIAEHLCKGSKDMQSSTTAGSSELKIYKGLKDDYYLKDFWRAFPSEIPEATPHLHRAPRGQSVFWRQLRPEYVRTCLEPLSPDACCSIAYQMPDNDAHHERLTKSCHSLINDVIPDFLEGLLNREYLVPLSEGYGLDLTSEMHAVGINMRHMGLMRYRLWRPLPGTVSMYHHEQCIRTSQDLRQELSDGDVIEVAGATYTVREEGEGEGEGKRRKITHSQVPVVETYLGESVNGLTGRVGRTKIKDKNNSELRLILLAEMLARTIKAVIRLQMRTYNQQYQCTSTQFFAALVTEYLNMLSGSSPTADVLMQQTICEALRDRYGERAIQPSEQPALLTSIQPVISYLVNRVVAMLGVRLNISCSSEFHERPIGFVFTVSDILEVQPVTKHNIPMLPFADAMIVSLQAAEMEREVYSDEVLRDQPALFLTLSERKGARLADNKGLLGDVYSGTVKKECELEHTGPVVCDKFIRAIVFRPNAHSYIDVKYHPTIAPSHVLDNFTVELYFCVQGGKDTVRTMLMSGRYAVTASRDNYLTVVFIDGLHEINIKLVPIEYDKWTHLTFAYDGTTIRCYVNSVLMKQAEVEGILKFKQLAYEQRVELRKKDLLSAEHAECMEIREKSKQDALEFFQTKDGVSTLKRLTKEIMESDAFQAEGIGAGAKDQSSAIKERRTEGLKRAKAKYMYDHYTELVAEIRKRYEGLLEDFHAHIAREKQEAAERVQQRLRIGSEVPNSKTTDGSHIFYGKLSCISVYATALSSDRIKDHYLSSVVDRRLDAQRLHGIAAAKFELALKQGPPQGSITILQSYAKSLCSYLRIESPDSMQRAKMKGKLKILDMVHQFKGMRQASAIAEIMREVPRDAAHADIIARGFLSIREVDTSFFSRSQGLQRKDLIHMPFDFALTSPESPMEHWEAAAYMFREVVRDIELMFTYGDLDLRWLPEIQSAPLVISLVKAALEDGNLRVVRLSELFSDAGLEDMAVNDDDIQVMSQNLSIAEGFDLSKCVRLTNASLNHIDRMNNVKVLSMNYCPLINDLGLKSIRSLYVKLQIISIEGMSLISDDGFSTIVDKCTKLVQVNVNKCPNITEKTLLPIVKNNPMLSSLQMSGTRLSDESFALVCAAMVQVGSGKNMTNMDISLCRDLTDHSIICLAESCPALRRLNMTGLSRVSDLGVRAVCSNCWYLQNLNLEDIFLLKDDAFWFSATRDGRRAANENMLTSLQVLNLTDCSNFTDRGIDGLAERCRKLDELTLRGCDKLSDQGLKFLSDPTHSTASDTPMCDTIHKLNLAYCTGLTGPGILSMLTACATLEDLDLSGLATIATDSFVHSVSRTVPTLQRLTLHKCLLLTDAVLCSLADNLWLEHLDVTGCHKLSDAGLEVLSEACSGLRSVCVRRVKKITNKTVFALLRNCTGIQKIDVQDCPLVSRACLTEAKSIKAAIKIASSFSAADRTVTAGSTGSEILHK